jgi:hypothetical protein
VRRHGKILIEKDAMEKAMKCHGKIRREKRCYRKTCENIPIKIVHHITQKRK